MVQNLLLIVLTISLLLNGTPLTLGLEALPDSNLDIPQEAGAITMQERMLTIPSFDGYEIEGKLRLPQKAKTDKLVIYVNSSGPHTYDDHRMLGEQEFNYFDLFAEQFVKDDIAFFSYHTRGVRLGEEPPLYADIDPNVYQEYIPSNEIKDVECMIEYLKSLDELAEAKVYLLGWSAGAMIAPQVALAGNVAVDALLLAGYANGTMAETLEWQQSGGSSMVFYCQYFDYDGDGEISREELEEDRYQIGAYLGLSFEALDQNNDDKINRADFALLLAENREAVFSAFENGDDVWLEENYGVRLTSAWYLDYTRIAANREVLPQLDLPIHIFHGTFDANIDVQDVRDIEARFHELGKTNLDVHIFADADHDLNYLQYITEGIIPEGIAAIFETCRALDTK